MKSKHYLHIMTTMLLLIAVLTGCVPVSPQSETTFTETNLNMQSKVLPSTDGSEMTVHFLDVGQGLAIFVQSKGQCLIYDGGDRDTSSFVVSYLQDLGVEKIDYLISSHYDSDHLAGLIGCLNVFEVTNVISADYEHDSKLYTSFINTLTEKKLSMQHPAAGTEFAFGNGSFTILAPESITADSNANSVVIKLKNGENSFVFTGDADHNSETAMSSSVLDLSCDVLSIGHHGSASCTSYSFLQNTLPETAVISCGTGNQYGHPAKDTMDKLESMEIEVFRTDKQGTITAISDGTAITWSTSPCNDYSPGDKNDKGTVPASESGNSSRKIQPDDSYVWKSQSGSKYHRIPDCGQMNPDTAVQITVEEAAALGLESCKKCVNSAK